MSTQSPWGVLFSDPRHLRCDLTLFLRALKQSWPIPTSARSDLLNRYRRACEADQVQRSVTADRIRALTEKINATLVSKGWIERDIVTVAERREPPYPTPNPEV